MFAKKSHNRYILKRIVFGWFDLRHIMVTDKSKLLQMTLISFSIEECLHICNNVYLYDPPLHIPFIRSFCVSIYSCQQ